MALLEVNNLNVKLQTHRGPAYAVRDMSFSLERGETLGLVGESGCGKSISVMALMGLLPENAQVTGSIRFDGEELTGKSDRELCAIRGNRIGMIFQEPMTALEPGSHHRPASGRAVAAAPRAVVRPTPARKPSRCWTASAFPMRPGASTPTRTSFPADSASASPSPWPWPAGPTC